MIANRNRSARVQSRMVGTQHMVEAEAPASMLVAVTRIPPGAIILGGHVEVVEGFSAGTVQPVFVAPDGTETALTALAVNATAAGFTAYDAGLPLRAPEGGWIKADTASTDPTQAGGDIVFQTEYVVDGRWTEVMPEFDVAPEDVAT